MRGHCGKLANSIWWQTISMPVACILLTWNPLKWSPTFPEDEAFIRATEGDRSVLPFTDRWSVGNRNQIDPGTKFFLLRQGTERGLIATGSVTSPVHVGPHWDGSRRPSRYVEIEFEEFVASNHRLPTELLIEAIPGVPWNYIQMSGIELHDHYFSNVAPGNWTALKDLWDNFASK